MRLRETVGRVPPRGSSVLEATDLFDKVEHAWKSERPDLDLHAACVLLRMEHATQMHNARVQAIGDAIGLGSGDLYVLLALRRAGAPFELRPTDLFRSLLVTSGAVTKRVGRLQALGYVGRVSADGDGRSELVRLTKKGRKIADRCIGDVADVVGQVMDASGISPEDLAVMNRCLRKLLSTGESPKEEQVRSSIEKKL